MSFIFDMGIKIKPFHSSFFFNNAKIFFRLFSLEPSQTNNK